MGLPNSFLCDVVCFLVGGLAKSNLLDSIYFGSILSSASRGDSDGRKGGATPEGHKGQAGLRRSPKQQVGEGPKRKRGYFRDSQLGVRRLNTHQGGKKI